ncbi:hypothetical protein SmJEL517_g00427 [Synchytrium microbalum]|uniref:Uncharacterized protein n=1 Tax=Synchytrium microbalum TaxID=1806994 RepID=A0A507CIA8_9FUNG|nr:uncharacterized protein SmJEL517_g00427 [Synchytrium microbalum]TPX37425.1 hypothetical protein SmJEL517_g00427 [Synchytrium microbalum]
MIPIVVLGLLIPSSHGYNYKDNIVYMRGLPADTSCTQNADGSATFSTSFLVKSKGSQPNGDDGVVVSFACANTEQIKSGQDWYNCKNPTAGMNGTVMMCGLADDISQYGGTLTCPKTQCTDPAPFAMTAVDNTGTNMPVVGTLVAPNLENKCSAGNTTVNIVQMNHDYFCWNGGNQQATRSVGTIVLVNCKRPSDHLSTIITTWSHPVTIAKETFGIGNPKTDGTKFTFDVQKGSVGGGALLTGGGPCSSIDPKTNHGIETAGQEFKMLSCTATLSGKDVPCTVGFDNIGGNTKYYQWIATGPDPFLLTAQGAGKTVSC